MHFAIWFRQYGLSSQTSVRKYLGSGEWTLQTGSLHLISCWNGRDSWGLFAGGMVETGIYEYAEVLPVVRIVFWQTGHLI